MSAMQMMQDFWKRHFAGKATRSTISVNGSTRPMTERERQLMDQAFTQLEGTFTAIQRVFDEARTEDERRQKAGSP